MNATEPTLQSVLPASSQEVIAKSLGEDFKSKLKLPKGMNRHLVARAVDRVLLEGLDLSEVKSQMGLVQNELRYVSDVVDEFRAWEAANKPAPATEEKKS